MSTAISLVVQIPIIILIGLVIIYRKEVSPFIRWMLRHIEGGDNQIKYLNIAILVLCVIVWITLYSIVLSNNTKLLDSSITKEKKNSIQKLQNVYIPIYFIVSFIVVFFVFKKLRDMKTFEGKAKSILQKGSDAFYDFIGDKKSSLQNLFGIRNSSI